MTKKIYLYLFLASVYIGITIVQPVILGDHCAQTCNTYSSGQIQCGNTQTCLCTIGGDPPRCTDVWNCEVDAVCNGNVQSGTHSTSSSSCPSGTYYKNNNCCTASSSLNPSSSTWYTTTDSQQNTWTITLTDTRGYATVSRCADSITYSVELSNSGCASPSVSTNSITLSLGGSNQFTLSGQRSGSDCSMTVRIKDPAGNAVTSGTYEIKYYSCRDTPYSCRYDRSCGTSNCPDGEYECQSGGTYSPVCKPQTSCRTDGTYCRTDTSTLETRNYGCSSGSCTYAVTGTTPCSPFGCDTSQGDGLQSCKTSCREGPPSSAPQECANGNICKTNTCVSCTGQSQDECQKQYGQNYKCDSGSCTYHEPSGNDAPTLTSIQISPQYVKKDADITVTSIASDPNTQTNDKIVLSCASSKDGEFTANKLCETTSQVSTNPSCTFKSPWTDNAQKTIWCKVKDNVGSLSNEVSATITSDNTAPTIAITTSKNRNLDPNRASTYGRYEITYTATTGADSAGISQIRILKDGNLIGNACTGGSSTCTVKQDYNCGPFTITADVRDNAGNTRTSSSTQFATSQQCNGIYSGYCGTGGWCDDSCNLVTPEAGLEPCACEVRKLQFVTNSLNTYTGPYPDFQVAPGFFTTAYKSSGWTGDLAGQKCVGDVAGEHLVAQVSSWNSCGGVEFTDYRKVQCPKDQSGTNCFVCTNSVMSSNSNEKCVWKNSLYTAGTRVDADNNGKEDIICISGSSGWFDIPVIENFEYYGDLSEFNVKYETLYPIDPSRDMKVKCGLNCDPRTEDCSNIAGETCVPYDQALGTANTKEGNCAVDNPSYQISSINKIQCLFYDPNRPDVNTYANHDFKPIDFEIRSTNLITSAVGQPFELKVDITNKGILSDSYKVTFASSDGSIVATSPSSVNTESVGSGQVEGVIASVVPLVDQDGTITITVTSNSCDPSGNPDCPTGEWTVQLRPGLLSLPEFGLMGFLQIVLIAAIIYFLLWDIMKARKKTKQKRSRKKRR